MAFKSAAQRKAVMSKMQKCSLEKVNLFDNRTNLEVEFRDSEGKGRLRTFKRDPEETSRIRKKGGKFVVYRPI